MTWSKNHKNEQVARPQSNQSIFRQRHHLYDVASSPNESNRNKRAFVEMNVKHTRQTDLFGDMLWKLVSTI